MSKGATPRSHVTGQRGVRALTRLNFLRVDLPSLLLTDPSTLHPLPKRSTMSSDTPPPLGELITSLVEPAQLMIWAMTRKCLPSGVVGISLHSVHFPILVALNVCFESSHVSHFVFGCIPR